MAMTYVSAGVTARRPSTGGDVQRDAITRSAQSSATAGLRPADSRWMTGGAACRNPRANETILGPAPHDSQVLAPSLADCVHRRARRGRAGVADAGTTAR